MIENQRNLSWDFVKLMFLIVFGHFCPAGESWTLVTRIVGLCAILGFFFVSDYFQSRITSDADFVGKLCKTLLHIVVPMTAWGVVLQPFVENDSFSFICLFYVIGMLFKHACRNESPVWSVLALVLVILYRPYLLPFLFFGKGWLAQLVMYAVGFGVSLLVYRLMQELCTWCKGSRWLRVVLMGTK